MDDGVIAVKDSETPIEMKNSLIKFLLKFMEISLEMSRRPSMLKYTPTSQHVSRIDGLRDISRLISIK